MVKTETNYITSKLTMKNLYGALLFCIIVQCLFGFSSNMYSDSAYLHSEIIIATNRSNTPKQPSCPYNHFHKHSLGIDDIFSIWQELLHSLVLTHCEIDHRFVSHLLNHTQHTLQQITNIGREQPLLIESITRDYQYNYHDVIALRRTIMIIMNRHSHHPKLAITYNKIIGYFMKLFETYLAQRRDYAWFHIHITKSGGTSVRVTFDETFGANGSSYYWNINDPPCARQYRAHSGLRYVEREQALFTHNDYFPPKKHRKHFNPYHGPSLCNKFIYILPFRQPLERICSQSSQINKHPIFNNQNILRTYASYQAVRANLSNIPSVYHFDKMDYLCYNKNISINGVDYRVLLEPIDYRHFYVELLESERDAAYMELAHVKSNQDVWDRIEKTSVMTENITSLNLSQCWKHPEQLRWTPVRYNGKASQLENSEFIIVTKKNAVDIAWHRCISASNVFTSWLGYNYSKEITNFAMISNYVPRYSINESHFINAVDVMMQIDYVLPFESFTNNKSLMINKEHQIWRIMLEHMYDYFNGSLDGTSKKDIRWSHLNPSSSSKGKIHAFDICEVMSEEDRQILDEYNQFDYKLYNISKQIEIADVMFYNRFVEAFST
eukprot:270814_1